LPRVSADGLTASVEKMRREGVGDAAVGTFAHYYRRLRDGETGVLPEAEIEPVAEAPYADDLPDAGEEGRAALFYTDYALPLVGLRDGSWKFIHELDSGRSKLFDLCSDPGETNDLAPKLPERVAEYLPRLQQWSAAQKDLILRCQR